MTLSLYARRNIGGADLSFSLRIKAVFSPREITRELPLKFLLYRPKICDTMKVRESGVDSHDLLDDPDQEVI